jgi:hypothetical protein
MLCALAASLAACGVSFRPAPEGTEFFKSLDVSGDRRAGATLTASLGYAQNNPRDVQLACELRQGKDLVQPIGMQNVPAIFGGGPERTPVPGTYTFGFTVEQAGDYKVECYTPADEDNYIIKTLTVT